MYLMENKIIYAILVILIVTVARLCMLPFKEKPKRLAVAFVGILAILGVTHIVGKMSHSYYELKDNLLKASDIYFNGEKIGKDILTADEMMRYTVKYSENGDIYLFSE